MNQPTPKRVRVPVHGVLLLDKSDGMSSNDALIKAKRLLNAQKAGHTGTLDPFATGLLPLCFGEATKFSQDLLEADKTYETEVHLGVSTSTGDTEGEVIAQHAVVCNKDQVEQVLQQFRGPIDQVPPMHSALKRDGKPLYEYARAGITLEREARRVNILELTLLDYEAPIVRLRVRCSKGTYIRVLGEDIGQALGCGAHLRSLRRTSVGTLTLDGALTLQQFEKIPDVERPLNLAPVDALLSTFPMVQLGDALADRFMHGQRLAIDKEAIVVPTSESGHETERVRVYRTSNHTLLGTALVKADRLLAPERLVSLGA